MGAMAAYALEAMGVIDRWSRFRARWFVPDSRGALVLLALWPLALLFPASVPLGLGQVMERVEEGLADWLADTPFLEWVPLREVELQPLLPGVELLCVMLGAADSLPAGVFASSGPWASGWCWLVGTLAAGLGGLGPVGGAQLRAQPCLGLAQPAGSGGIGRRRLFWPCCCCRCPGAPVRRWCCWPWCCI